ncbi:unnamed protein product [Tilletia controversa]|uniref:VTT domain-containing protein n=3 Tax=Tilletia TaxID=13289 RepID=A0A8X7MZ25_9BASI|nr:hypothetical protein CF328_g3746 [Tilletia controversa]KAE8198921.1 hypothetical protein CF336_g1446 [Tilletia laevis]KAE8264262.1 hypothetical protein A4X03_0g1077 [Tilletia caries]KAE8207699.1 hypothetical protein CF335_g957 [Tilletia laevis]KAE8254025.1 hypothetical protein A4X06_0g1109 [Tilletia controversa]
MSVSRNRKIDSAAAARALNSSSNSISGAPSAGTASPVKNGRASAASPTASGKPRDKAAAARDRRSANSSTASQSAQPRLPTTRVSVAPSEGGLMAEAGKAAAALGPVARAKRSTREGSSSEAAARLSYGASAADEPLLKSDADGGASKDDSDAASVQSAHTLKTIRDGTSPSGSSVTLPKSASKGSRANGNGNLHLLPSSDDADDEAGAIDVHAWEGASSSGPTGASGPDLEGEDAATAAAELSRWRRRVLLRTALRLLILFVFCSIALVGTLWIALPEIDEKDRPFLKIPKSLADLKLLNEVLQHYKDEYSARVVLCWVVVYMFLQAFSIPGSMYMSILAGALWGVPVALPLVCASVATGATICYLISQTMGEALVAVPAWKARVDSWKERLAEYDDNLLSYLIIIRMMPLPPHNVVNLISPHLGISIPHFWISTALGIFAMSFIHTTIGEKLDDMASSDDFNLLSVRNVLLFAGVCGAVMIPVLIRKRAPVAPLEEAGGAVGAVRLPDDDAEGGQNASNTGSVRALGRSILIGARRLGLPGRAQERDDFRADYDDDADELPHVSDPDELAIAAAASQSRASSLSKAARVLRPPGPPGPEDVDDVDPTEAWSTPFGAHAAVGDDADSSDARSEDSHLSAPFSDDRREDRGPGRERGPRRKGSSSSAASNRRGGLGRPGQGRPGSWAGAGADALGDVAGRVRSFFGGNGVALR